MKSEFENTRKMKQLDQNRLSDFIEEYTIVAPPPPSEPGGRPARFRDDSWNLASLKNPPSPGDYLPLSFKSVPEAWKVTVKEIVFYALFPNHQILIERGLSARRSPASPKSAAQLVFGLQQVAAWAENNDIRPLLHWDHREADIFMQALSGFSPQSKYPRVMAFRKLNQYAPALTGGGMPSAPWPMEISTSSIVGMPVTNQLKTMPLSPDEWSSNVTAAWHLVDKVSDDALVAREVFRIGLREQGENLSQEEFLRRIEDLSAIPVTFVERDGHQEPRRNINQRLIFQMVAGSRTRPEWFTPSSHEQIRSRVKGARTFADSAYQFARLHGKTIPDTWATNLPFQKLGYLISHIQSACYIVISAFTMMRDSEILALPRDCLTSHYGVPAIKGRKFKKESESTPQYWWISDAVKRAIEVMEQISGSEDYLFGSPFRKYDGVRYQDSPRHMNGERRRALVNFVNKNADGLGVPPMSTQISARVLRRTMATIVGTAEDGQLALANQLKHATSFTVANSLTSAYAEPDPRWSETILKSRHAAAVDKLVEQWSSTATSEPFSGPASPILESAPGAPVKGSARTLRRWLAGKFPQLRLGTVNHCLGDSSVAACLTPDARARGDLPDPSFCQPADCRNSFCDRNQQEVIRSERDMLKELRARPKISKRTSSEIDGRINQVERMLRRGKD